MTIPNSTFRHAQQSKYEEKIERTKKGDNTENDRQMTITKTCATTHNSQDADGAMKYNMADKLGQVKILGMNY